MARTTNADAAGNAATKVSGLTGSPPSRIGFRGSEDLGGALAAVSALESGFNPDSGTAGQGGRLFGRQARVGLKGKWVTLQVGRILNMTFLATARSDVLGPKLFSINSIGLYLPNASTARRDNGKAACRASAQQAACEQGFRKPGSGAGWT